MRETLRFLLGAELIEIERCDPTLTVLDWLRLDRRMTGSKEGCAEGDCGACTVVVGRLDGGRLRYEAINACIRFLPTLDGCQLLTVEHLKGADDGLHPVQQAMVDCHGSQCGFCTGCRPSSAPFRCSTVSSWQPSSVGWKRMQALIAS